MLAVCRRVRSSFVLWRLKALDPPHRPKLVTFALEGNVTVLGDGTITVRNDDRGRVLKCTVPARFGKLMAKLEVSKRVTMLCRGVRDVVPELAQITLLPQPARVVIPGY